MARRELQIIGRIDKVDLPQFQLENVPAKIDTGAFGSAIHCREIHVIEGSEGKEIAFKIPSELPGPGRIFHSKDYSIKKVKSSTGQAEERYVITTGIVLFGREIETTFSLADRSEMKFPILIGRKVLQKRFKVDVSRTNLSYKAKSK